MNSHVEPEVVGELQADRGRLEDVLAVVKLEHRHAAQRVPLAMGVRLAVLAGDDSDVVGHADLLREHPQDARGA